MNDGTALPTVGYADALGRHGVIVDRNDGHLRLTFPQRLSTGQIIGLVLLAAYGLAAAIEYGISAYRGEWLDFNLLVPAVGISGLVGYLRYRRRPIVITLDANTLKIEGYRPSKDGDRIVTIVRSRERIYRVYYIEWAQSLFVRARGKEMVELPIPHGPIVGRELAALIVAELGLSDEQPTPLHPHPLA